MSEQESTNRLIHETSPYLVQHAHNPVDWYPWGEEALRVSRTDDRPILLSIGYSACHWCHVMAHESFENPEIASVMNDHFVNIKVDREERPDLDEIYMNAVSAMTGSGGWPMTVFLTPDLKPFYGGTYFPPDDRYGRPGFLRILSAVSQFFKDRRPDAVKQGDELQERLTEIARFSSSVSSIDEALLDTAHMAIAESFDPVNGGFGTQPKFPGSMSLSFCLGEYQRARKNQLLEIVRTSLKKMADGGIYDHLGGGFHRYSVDAEWLIPHFEKMLYDNALLIRLYMEAYRLTQDSHYRRVVEETADYVIREMLQPGGGFYATQDADSEGEEGKFFAWTPGQVVEILGPDDGGIFCRYYGVEETGNFEHGTSVLHVPVEADTLAVQLKIDDGQLESVLAKGRARLFDVRERRVKPDRDEKILTDWNGLMIGSLARAYSLLGNRVHLSAAEGSMRFVLDTMYHEGRLLHVYKNGEAKLNGYLDDYAFLVSALLDLYEASFDTAWFQMAVRLNETMIAQFWDHDAGGFFFTSSDHEQLIVRSKNPYDNAIPSGNSVAVNNLLRLAAYTGRSDYREMAEKTLILFHDLMKSAPGGFGQLLSDVAWYLDGGVEIAIVGSAADPVTVALLETARRKALRHAVIAFHDPGKGPAPVDLIPLLAERHAVNGKPTAYVCRNMVCQQPVWTADELNMLLDGL